MSLAKGLSFLFFKEPAFGFIDLFHCFIYLYSIYFCSDFYDFIPSTKLGFVFSSINLGKRLSCLFEIFLTACITINFPLRLQLLHPILFSFYFQVDGLRRAFLAANMVKNLPAVQEVWVWSLDPEDPLEKGMATHFSILAWRIPWTEEPGRLHTVFGVAKGGTQLSD